MKHLILSFILFTTPVFAADHSISLNKSQEAGVAAALEAYNTSLPDVFEGEGEERRAVNPKPGTLSSNTDYIQMVMSNAANSYSKQFGMDITEIDSKISELQAKRAVAVERTK